MKIAIPKEVENIARALEAAGFEAYVVGGCVRDLLLGREPEDWDVATSAKPEEVQSIFPENFYENKFFTVTVQTGSQDPKLQNVEVTTFRADVRYGDRRHPEEVRYAKTIEEDLARRDFTVNAIAIKIKNQTSLLRSTSYGGQAKIKITNQKSKFEETNNFEIVDSFGGQEDLEKKIIRAVGGPEERFGEDALRMMRAVRLGATLGFAIDSETKKAMQKNAALLKEISAERVRDEFLKIIMSERAKEGVEELRETGLLSTIMPELEEGYGVGQNKHHIYDVWTHNLLALQYAAKQKCSPAVRIAALLHDVGKPRTKQGEGPDSTFYAHEVVGASMARRILSRLKFSSKDIQKITLLVRYHLFYYNVGEVTESSIRRLLRKVGHENINDLLEVRMADRIGSGVPKAEPYKLRHLRYLIEKVSKDPISAKMLKLNGSDVMKLLDIMPGPRVGSILDALLGEVLEDPKKNTREYLENKAKELHTMSDEALAELRKSSRLEKEEAQSEEDSAIKQKYWVK